MTRQSQQRKCYALSDFSCKSFMCTSSCVPAEQTRINQRQYPRKKGVLGKCSPLCINQINSDWKHPQEQPRFLWSFSNEVIFFQVVPQFTLTKHFTSICLWNLKICLATRSITLVNFFFFFSQGNGSKGSLSNYPKVAKPDVNRARPSSEFLLS